MKTLERSQVSLAFLVLVLAAACRPHAPVVGETTRVGPTNEPVLAPESTREVMAKQAPDALIARDGSSCRVAPDVYTSTSTGSLFRCRWVRG